MAEQSAIVGSSLEVPRLYVAGTGDHVELEIPLEPSYDGYRVSAVDVTNAMQEQGGRAETQQLIIRQALDNSLIYFADKRAHLDRINRLLFVGDRDTGIWNTPWQVLHALALGMNNVKSAEQLFTEVFHEPWPNDHREMETARRRIHQNITRIRIALGDELGDRRYGALRTATRGAGWVLLRNLLES
jgi:hypothetical protein